MRDETLLGAGAAAVALFLRDAAMTSFGLPIGAVIAAFSGALFGVVYLPAESRMGKPLAALINTLAACCLTGGVTYLLKIEAPAVMSMVAFVIAAAPLPALRKIQDRFGVKNEPR